MNPSTTPQPERLLSIDDVAEIIGLAPGTLRNWRVAGRGPRGARIGGRVRYRRADVDAWITQQTERDPLVDRRERVSEFATQKAFRR
jgi:excisionase family DNA binding protein